MTTSIYTSKAKAVHGDTYDYTNTLYTKAHNKVEIICSKHGSFWQAANDHLKGRGCKQCGTESRTKKNLKTHESFVKDSRKIHGNKYEYPDKYTTSYNKIDIICNVHGIFKQRPRAHTNSRQGCPECGKILIRESKLKSHDEFIHHAKSVHGDKWIYDKTIYKSGYDKVEIGCNTHGYFWQMPFDHTHARAGCPICAQINRGSGFYVSKDDITANHIYSTYTITLTGNGETFYKTGISNNVNNRIKDFAKIGYVAEIIQIVIDTKRNCFLLEQKILNKYRRKGKMYIPLIDMEGKTECYEKT